jgi:hypothetical protein
MKSKYTIRLALAVVLLWTTAACNATHRAGFTQAMYNYRVNVYSGGTLVKTYRTQGTPLNEEKSDGFRFVDIDSGKLIRVSGTVIIEQE